MKRESLLFGLMIPLTFAGLLPAGISLCGARLWLPAYMLGLTTAIFLRECSPPLTAALSNVLLGWLFIGGHTVIPLWLCLILQGLYLPHKWSAPFALLPFGLGICLPAQSGTLAGVITVALGAFSLQNALAQIGEWNPKFASLGVAVATVLLLL